MDNVIIIRYGELFLKGKNRGFFERLLSEDIKRKLKGFDCTLNFGRGRYLVENFNQSDAADIIKRLSRVFGLHSLSKAIRVPSDIQSISEAALSLIPQQGSFRVNTNRADKAFPFRSMQVSAELGDVILKKNPDLKVDLHTPEFVVNVDIREDKHTLVYTGSVPAAGGMPLGSAGKGLLLLSGGLDSPVAGYMMAKRGVKLTALHFHSYPYTGVEAQEKVRELSEKLCRYVDSMTLISAPLTKIQEAIHKYCNPDYTITVLRRCMMQIAERIAIDRGLGCIINGESLGQVASQTMQSITVTNSVIRHLPVLRPLIGMDKQEIIDIAYRIDTYSVSVRPYEDCCTVFLPDSPVTKPSIRNTEREESKIEELQALIEESLDNLEIVRVEVQ